MAGLTSTIEQFIKELLNETAEGFVEIGRNDLAVRFNCAPSQINYVLTTRFTPYKGYHIESRRGGSGYIRIIKLSLDKRDYIDQLANQTIGDCITVDKAAHLLATLAEEEVITTREAALMRCAIDNNALGIVKPEYRNEMRASILKNMLLVFLR